MSSRVVVVGAGVAGLSAARHLRAHGVPTTLVEAGARIGGRAFTTALGPDPFDHGATWLHDADRNPLVHLATAEDALACSDDIGERRLSLAGRVATAAERADYEACWDSIDQVVAPALQGSDTTLAAAMAALDGNPWAPLVALWEGAIIAAADADRLGLQDWHRNQLQGRNMVPRAGVGAFVARRLQTDAQLDTAATRIRWGGRGVQVDTTRGVLDAEAAIVTVSTGVLAAGGIAFDPALPQDVDAAIHALPMGLLSKVAFGEGADRMGLPADTGLVDRDGRMTFRAWPQGRGYVSGFMGGALAWSVADDPRAAEAVARAEFRKAMGTELGPFLLATGWGTDPLFRGAYAYAGPGEAGARGVLEAAFPGERLMFAGEATRTDGLAGTVGGAWLAGRDAAARWLARGRGVW